MENDKKVIEQLRRSLQISVTVSVLMALAFAVIIVVYTTVGFPAWQPEQWFATKETPNPYDIVPRTHPDSNTLAISRKLSMWKGPNADDAPANDTGELIRYGRDLIARTAVYLGPKGAVAQITNGMNCQNCHLDAGNKIWGNNYGAVASTYPKFRERSGKVEDIFKRINDCMERSLNGQAIAEDSKEMKAMATYINWLGHEIPKKEIPNGSGIAALPFLNRASSPEKGKKVYNQKCASCHGSGGQGIMAGDGISYTYPPLWGEHSYNSGAGLFRLSRLAGYIKNNMPFGVTWQNPQLGDEECWDVAAYINSRPRPSKDLSGDWPNLLGKPVDHPFGPYADGFSEQQHKFGPFEPIQKEIKALKSKQSK